MVAPIVWGLVALGTAIAGAVGCSDDDEAGGGSGVGDADTDTDTDVDADADSDSDTDTAVDAGPDPSLRDGFNGSFYQFQHNSVGTIVDMDIDAEEHPDQILLMTDYPHNRLGRVDFDAGDLMSAPESSFAMGFFDNLGAEVETGGHIRPVQVVKLEDGRYFVPSALGDGASENAKNLISLIDPDCSSYTSTNVKSSLLDHFCEIEEDAGPDGGTGGVAYSNDSADCSSFDTDPDAGVEEVHHPYKVMSGIMAGGTIYVAASSEHDDSGSVIGFGFTPQGYIDAGHPTVVIPTSGALPSAIEYLGDNRVAVLNTTGVPGASIDIIDLLDAQVEANIPLGMDAAALSQLPITQDGQYAIVSASNFPTQANLMVVDLISHTIESLINLTESGTVRDIALLGYKAYVSVDSGALKGTSGEVMIVDFEAADSPSVERVIEVGFDSGAIAVHGGGNVFVVVTNRWWETPGSTPERWSYIIRFDPAQVTEDQLGD